MKRILIPILITALLSLAFGSGYASQDSTALGSAFTYQGQLLDGETPVNGACDFVFALWSAAAGGSQLGSGQAVDNVTITNGLFVVTLNAGGEFTASAFDGSGRWLEVSARCPSGSGAYTTLAPRQPLQPSPYALYSGSTPWSGLSDIPAGFADSVDNDTQYTAGSGLALNGTEFTVTGAPWGGLIGVPTGFADGVDDDTLFTAGSGLVLTGTQFSVTGAPWAGLSGVPAGFADGVDNDTTYTAGSGLALTDTQFSVTGAPWGGLTDIPAGFADGIDDNTTYSAGSGLALNGTQFSVTGAPWSGLSGVPAGFADGIDNDTTYTAGAGLALNGTQFSAVGSAYQNVVIVAKSGGDFSTIQAALNSISDASEANRYLVFVAPGVYEERVTMKAYVDLVGSGPGVTTLQYNGASSPTTSTLVLALSSSVRDLSVEAASNGQGYATAVYAENLSEASLQNLVVEVAASGGGSPELRGIYAVDSTLALDRVEIRSDSASSVTSGIYASGGTLDIFGGSIQVFSPNTCYGVRGSSGAKFNLTSVLIAAGGATFYGVYATSTTNVVNTQIELGKPDASYGTGYGLYGNGSFFLTISGSGIRIATGMTGSVQVTTAYFVYLTGGTFTGIASSQLYVVDLAGSSTDTGIYLGSAGTGGYLYLDNCEVFGMDTSLRGNTGWNVYVGASQLGGTLNKNGATTTCAASYNGSYVALTSTCVP